MSHFQITWPALKNIRRMESKIERIFKTAAHLNQGLKEIGLAP